MFFWSALAVLPSHWSFAMMASSGTSPATATVGTGVTMNTLTSAIAAAGYGFCAIPAPGDITVGGALAINAHGSAIPATGETMLSGQTYGSLSNLILSLTAVVWKTGGAISIGEADIAHVARHCRMNATPTPGGQILTVEEPGPTLILNPQDH